MQQSLGVPLNYTYNSDLAAALFGLNGSPDLYPFAGTGDGVRQAGGPNLEYLLANGVKVALIYGDRDYRCPWTQAEATAKVAKWTHQQGFVSAGYTKIQGILNDHQGVVKQFGLLSFSRILIPVIRSMLMPLSQCTGYSNGRCWEKTLQRAPKLLLGSDIIPRDRPAVGAGGISSPLTCHIRAWSKGTGLRQIRGMRCLEHNDFRRGMPT